MKQLRKYQQEAHDKIMARMKEVTHPLLINMSVGAGKSLLAASILLRIEKSGYRALCLTMNSTLILQNHETYLAQGGNSGIYCSGLKSKRTIDPIIFASPHSAEKSIKKNNKLSEVKFNLIIIDECQNVDAHQSKSMYMRVLNHYGRKAQEGNYSFRILGLSGTPYRGKSVSICGESELFKEEIVKIQMPWLIENGYLTKPIFGDDLVEVIDFSKCKVNSLGKFVNKDLEIALEKNERISARIMEQVISVVESYETGGAFIFCSTLRHVDECLRLLPDTARKITGDTPHYERKQILEDANNGKVKYLVNVATLLTGVDCPRFNVAAFCRPTESLTLFNQAVGRVLRLFPRKDHALILDYAQNLNRFQDFDDPIINEAVQPKEENQKDYVIICPACSQLNTDTARRCIGVTNSKRCDYYFEWKDCHACSNKNDITSRYCWSCEAELIDPNAKLSLKVAEESRIMNVNSVKYAVSGAQDSFLVHAAYYCNDIESPEVVYEYYRPTNLRVRNVFYGKFVRQHCDKPSDWYPKLMDMFAMERMIKEINSPVQLKVTQDDNGVYIIKKKIFS